MPKIIKKYGKITLILGLILAITGMYLVIPTSQAASATLESDTISDSRATVLANHDIKFKMDAATTIANTETIMITFTGFTAGATATEITDWAVLYDADGSGTYTNLLNTDNWTFTDHGAGADPHYLFTFTAAGAALIDTKKYIEITFTNGTGKLPNPAIGSYAIGIAGSFGDTGTTYVAITDAAGIAVTATVGEYLTFTVGEYTTEIGSWTAGNTVIRWADDSGGATSEPDPGQPIVLTIASNSTNGVSVTARSTGSGAAAGLYDSVSTNVIDAVGADKISGTTSPVAGTEGYALYLKNLSGTNLTIDEGYDDDAVSPVAIATTADVIIANTAAGGVTGTVDLALKAAIAATTQAGSYTDTIILVATPTY